VYLLIFTDGNKCSVVTIYFYSTNVTTLPSNTEVKNAWRCISTHLYDFITWLLIPRTLPLTFTIRHIIPSTFQNTEDQDFPMFWMDVKRGLLLWGKTKYYVFETEASRKIYGPKKVKVREKFRLLATLRGLHRLYRTGMIVIYTSGFDSWKCSGYNGRDWMHIQSVPFKEITYYGTKMESEAGSPPWHPSQGHPCC
jgi:hypothetical protein